MKMYPALVRVSNRWLVAGVLSLLAALPALAYLPDAPTSRDFLRRPPLSGYVNYGEEVYRPYRRQIRLQNRYDYLAISSPRVFWSTRWTSSGQVRASSARTPQTIGVGGGSRKLRKVIVKLSASQCHRRYWLNF